MELPGKSNEFPKSRIDLFSVASSSASSVQSIQKNKSNNLEAWFRRKLYDGKTESELNLLKHKGARKKDLKTLKICKNPNIQWKDFLENEKEIIKFNLRQSLKLNKNDFIIRGVISEKNNENIYLIKLKDENNGKFYAAKHLAKTVLDDKKSNKINEVKILQVIRCPFTTCAKFTVIDHQYIYLVMPIIIGKDLAKILNNFGTLKENLLRFYAAQVLLALEYLHNLDIIFRDIKPENIMIEHTGYLKLLGFEFAKYLEDGRTYTICGTPEYMAPECLSLQGYGNSVDWWAYGVLIYELSTGKTPFYDKDQDIMYSKIINCDYKITEDLSYDLRNFIEKFLKLEPTQRFGLRRYGINEIKQDKWMDGINWQQIVHKQVKPTYLPNVKNLKGNLLINRLEIPKEENDDLFYCDD